MNDMITGIEDLVKALKNLSPELLCIAALIICGYVIKLVPWMKNHWVPIVCILLGPVVYIGLFQPDPGSVPPNIRNPMVWQGLIGLLLGAAAFFIHDKLLNRLEDLLIARFPWARRLLDPLPTTTGTADSACDPPASKPLSRARREENGMD